VPADLRSWCGAGHDGLIPPAEWSFAVPVRRIIIFAATALLSAIPAVCAEPAFAGATAGWTTAPPVPAPAGATDSVLRDVSVLSSSNVWAVGAWWAGTPHPLAVHWDGTAWTDLPVPEAPLSSEDYSLAAVDAVTSADVWTVGSAESQATGPLIPSALALHYDGTTWTREPTTAGFVASQSSLADVDMRTAADGWAVGQQVVGSFPAQPLILRWTVDHFTPVPAPKIGSAAQLTSVFADAADDAWAVGSLQNATGRQEGLVLHWDGANWSRQTVPPAGAVDETLQSVAATGPGEVWAAGSTCAPTGATVCAPRVLHFTRDAWHAVPTALAATANEVVPFSPTDVWIFGQTTTQQDHIEHWDGVRFTTDGSVPPATGNGQPASAVALAAAAGDRTTGALWAVGWTGAGAHRNPHVIYRG
jgi:hypothetical protein